MSLKKEYKTVSDEGTAEFVDRKSRFIASVRPVDNEEDALAYLSKIRSRYSDARHNVYAYIIDENNIFRYSDDGEPSGTAGMPVLDTMRKAGIVDTIIVVTRYFGGTLLGTGGLVHAYGTAAGMGLENAGVVIRSLCDILSAELDYSLIGTVENKLRKDGYIIEESRYAESVTFVICVPQDKTDKLISELTDITNGKIICKKINTKYADREEQQQCPVK